jgi:hypothetical protein
MGSSSCPLSPRKYSFFEKEGKRRGKREGQKDLYIFSEKEGKRRGKREGQKEPVFVIR